MKRKNAKKYRSRYDAMLETPLSRAIVAVFAILMGVIFILQHNDNIPIEKSEAVTYTASFDKWEYDVCGRGTEYVELILENGDKYRVHYSCVNQQLEANLNTLSRNDSVTVLVNPFNDYVIEISSNNKDVLNLDYAQSQIEKSSKGFVGLGIFCVFGAFIMLIRELVLFLKSKR